MRIKELERGLKQTETVPVNKRSKSTNKRVYKEQDINTYDAHPGN